MERSVHRPLGQFDLRLARCVNYGFGERGASLPVVSESSIDPTTQLYANAASC